VGLSSSWLAVSGKPSEAVLQELGLAPTGERDELPAESPIAGTALAGGWYAVVFDHELVAEDVLRELSTGCDVVSGAVEEHVMYSAAQLWRDGELIWRVEHAAQEGILDLTAEGAVPPEFESLRSRRLDEQEASGGDDADVDYVFDVPPALAQLVTGFSYDLEPAEGFAVLAKLR
jgi:hypothetical protein